MAFFTLTEPDCGQGNSFVRFMEHATRDSACQENIGISVPCGQEQHGPMPPQSSFRVHDLMEQIQEIESQSTVPLTGIIQNPGITEYQTQEKFWTERDVGNNEARASVDASFQNFFSPAVLWHNESESYPPPIEYQQSQESIECLDDFTDNVVVNNLNELEDLEETEESCATLSEDDDSELYSEDENILEPIVEFDNPREFCKFLKMRAKLYRKETLGLPDSSEIFGRISRETLLDDTKRYQYFQNNPYKNDLKPYAKGLAALEKNSWRAVLYFDEAVQKDNVNVKNWVELSFAFLMTDQYEESLLAARELLRLDPGNYRGNLIASYIYNAAGNRYKACQSLFNWLKYNKSYSFLVPADFEMNDDNNKSFHLEEHQIKAVTRLFLKAVRLNPTNIDADLQIMMSELFELTDDYDKIADCIQTALNANPSLNLEWLNLGAALFQANKPYEALNAYLKACEFDKHQLEGYEGLGVIHMYLKDYREAIRCFKKRLEHEDSNNFQIKETTLEDQYELCLKLYFEIYNKSEQ